MDIIVDIDGTVADPSHRLHLVKDLPPGQKPDWEEFFARVEQDATNEPIVDLVWRLGSTRGTSLIGCTGRPERIRSKTARWLNAAGLFFDALYMRADGDHRPDHLVKRDLLKQMRLDGFDPKIAIDDRSSVVAMWRSEGLICLQCAEGDF